MRGQTNNIFKDVATAEKDETNLNWIERSRKLFFVGLRKSKHTENGRESRNVPKLGRDVRNIPILVKKVET